MTYGGWFSIAAVTLYALWQRHKYRQAEKDLEVSYKALSRSYKRIEKMAKSITESGAKFGLKPDPTKELPEEYLHRVAALILERQARWADRATERQAPAQPQRYGHVFDLDKGEGPLGAMLLRGEGHDVEEMRRRAGSTCSCTNDIDEDCPIHGWSEKIQATRHKPCGGRGCDLCGQTGIHQF